MSKYDNPEIICSALSAFIAEIRAQTAAIRAYDNVLRDKTISNTFLLRAHDSIWLGLLSEIARTFDKARTGSNENCTLFRLKELCLKDEYSVLFPNGENDTLIQGLCAILAEYNQLPIGKSRNKQLSHHDIGQIFEGDCITVSFDQVEKLVLDTTSVFEKIYTRFLLEIYEFSLPDYSLLVAQFEKDINLLLK